MICSSSTDKALFSFAELNSSGGVDFSLARSLSLRVGFRIIGSETAMKTSPRSLPLIVYSTVSTAAVTLKTIYNNIQKNQAAISLKSNH